MIQMSSLALPGGSSTLRTRCTRRSLLVTEPSDSSAAFEAGSTTSAISAVLVMNRSCTISVFRFPMSLRARPTSASEDAGFSPITYSAVRSPCSIASNICVRFLAVLRDDGDPADLFVARAGLRVLLDAWKPGNLLGIAPMSPPPCTLF